MNTLAATGHAGPNAAGWIVIVVLSVALAVALLLSRRNRNGGAL